MNSFWGKKSVFFPLFLVGNVSYFWRSTIYLKQFGQHFDIWASTYFYEPKLEFKRLVFLDILIEKWTCLLTDFTAVNISEITQDTIPSLASRKVFHKMAAQIILLAFPWFLFIFLADRVVYLSFCPGKPPVSISLTTVEPDLPLAG